jgi:arabinogalactan oligomer/maltooligosaccharide transport system permease protein
MLLILPWAIPNYITALIWKGMFQGQYGAVNSLLHAMHLHDVSWFSSWAAAFSANVVTNTWLGFPFMMVVALGALETIPRELYEAASVDGASAWQRFRHITLPHLRPALGPAVALGSIWTFNMFNVIFLVSAGKPGDSTNILVTDAYRYAFERGDRYGMAAAYATIIFLILLLWTVFGTRIVRSKDEAYA